MTKLLHVLLIYFSAFPCKLPLLPCFAGWKRSQHFRSPNTPNFICRSRHQNPGHQDLSGESHLIVSHSHVSRIIHGNQDRLGIPCWEDLVSLGANASIQNMRFSWIWGLNWQVFGVEKCHPFTGHSMTFRHSHKFRGAEIAYICIHKSQISHWWFQVFIQVSKATLSCWQ